jgi:hypothetical protein
VVPSHVSTCVWGSSAVPRHLCMCTCSLGRPSKQAVDALSLTLYSGQVTVDRQQGVRSVCSTESLGYMCVGFVCATESYCHSKTAADDDAFGGRSRPCWDTTARGRPPPCRSDGTLSLARDFYAAPRSGYRSLVSHEGVFHSRVSHSSCMQEQTSLRLTTVCVHAPPRQMLSGLTAPSAGTAVIQGKDIITSMAHIRENLGVCPQVGKWMTVTAASSSSPFPPS